MHTPAPDPTREQRISALEEGNRIRVYRANLKRDLKAGRRSIRDVILAGATDQRIATMKVADALLATPRIGRVKADKILRRVKVSPSKTLGGLTTRQRAELLEVAALTPRQPATAAAPEAA